MNHACLVLIRSLVAVAAAVASPSFAAAVASDPGAGMAARILALHNRERQAVGAPLLMWDPVLAAAAATYGPTLASLGRLAHAPRDSRPGQRENLSMGLVDRYGVDDLVDLWIEEKRHFQPGLFPFVSRTGNWKDVSHYTQMIWKSTTRVGCALHPANERHYLICRYSPPGNADGRAVP